MISHQNQTFPQPSSESIQEPRQWNHWKHDHQEFNRVNQSTVVIGDKVLILGGSFETGEKCSNLILLDPQNKSFKIVKSQSNDENLSCEPQASVCYWKDSKIVVFGGGDPEEERFSSTVAVVTLKDLDSDSPSAHWEKMKTTTELYRTGHTAHIYQDKMFVVGEKMEEWNERRDIRCLDLNTFIWSSFEDITIIKDVDNEITPVFHDNKVYIVPCSQVKKQAEATIQEIDLQTMNSREFKIAGKPTTNFFWKFCNQLIDGKICALTNGRQGPEATRRDVWAYDLNSNQWISIETKGEFPVAHFHAHLVACNGQLVYSGAWEMAPDCGEIWSICLISAF